VRIAVGSPSPAKLTAVEEVLRRAFAAAEIILVPVASGVPAMPRSLEETVRGARARAGAARARAGADLGVGIEGGVEPTSHGLFLTSWAAVVDAAGRVGLGSGPRVALPAEIAARLGEGEALGPLVDAVLGVPDARGRVGAIGWLTRGLLTREEAQRQAVAAALVPFLTSSREALPGPP